MRLRTRLWLGLIALSLLSVLVSGVGIYALLRQSHTSRAVLQENYRSLEYITQLHAALNQLQRLSMQHSQDSSAWDTAFSAFQVPLRKQEANITEEGELEATEHIRLRFESMRHSASNGNLLATVQEIRADLDLIARLNQTALLQKNVHATHTADVQQTVLGTTAALVLVFLFTFLFSYPRALLAPLEVITRKISAVAEGDYAQQMQVEATRKDEIGNLARAFNRMSQQLVAYQQTNIDQLQFERSRLTAVLHMLNEALVVLDAQLRVLVINPAAEALLGLQEVNLRGAYTPDIATTHDLLRTLIQPIMAAGQASSPKPIAIVLQGQTRQYQPEALVVHSKPEDGSQPTLLGYVLGLVDVTPFHAKDVAKTQFLATVSHELKTPLAGIGMSLRLLEDPRVGSLNKEQYSLLGNILGETERLKKLTGELLDLTQLESGNIQLHLQAVHLPELLQATVSVLQAQAQAQQVLFALQLAPHLPPVQADPDKLRWVLSNLLINAVRYSPAGGRVNIHADDSAGHVQITVSDEGAGIPPEYQARIFERYYRVPGQQDGGTGLGLAISREFVEAMGGTLSLQPQPKGTCFVLTLVPMPNIIG